MHTLLILLTNGERKQMSKIAVTSTESTHEFDVLQEFVEALRPDFVRFYNGGNKSAGRRIRKQLLELKKFAQHVRVDVLSVLKNES